MQTKTGLFVAPSLHMWAIMEGKTKMSYTGPKLVRFDVKRLEGKDKQFHQLKEKYKATKVQLERTKLELRIAKQQIKKMEVDIQLMKSDNEEVASKISETKVKVGLAQEMANNSKSDMEEMRDKYHKDQIEIARLEERLNGCLAEMDRLKNHENPDSILGIKKILTNDRKEIRRIKDAREESKKENIKLIRTLLSKTQKVEEAEEHLKSLNNEIQKSEKERDRALILADENKRMKHELKIKHDELLSHREKFGIRLKSTRARLGMTVSLRNVNMRMLDEHRETEKEHQRQIANLEKRLREAISKRNHIIAGNTVTKTQESVIEHKDRIRASKVQSFRKTMHTGPGLQGRMKLNKILVISRDGEAVPLSVEDTNRIFERRLPKLTETPRQGRTPRPKTLPSTRVTPNSELRVTAPLEFSRPWTRGTTPKTFEELMRDGSKSE